MTQAAKLIMTLKVKILTYYVTIMTKKIQNYEKIYATNYDINRNYDKNV